MKITFVTLGREDLGIEYLSAYLKKAGHKTSLAYDPGLFGLNDNVFYMPFLEKIFDRKKGIISDILKFKPDLVAFSVFTGTYQWARETARLIKEKYDVKIVFGGIHPTLVPDEVIKDDFVDYAATGEGEETFLELVCALEQGRETAAIRNLWLKKEGRVIGNELREPISNLDSLPYPDKDLFRKYVDYKYDFLYMSSRGCVFNCNYCCESYMNGIYRHRFYRRRTVSSVIKELKFMKGKYGFREILFFDAVLFSSKEWLKEFVYQYRAEIGVPFRCFAQINLFDREVAELLTAGGCYSVEFGIQTFNDRIRKEILGRHETNEKINEVLSACDEAGLKYDLDYMFGLPGETEADHIKAARLFCGLKNLVRIKPHKLTFFPGLKIAEIGFNKGILNGKDMQNLKKGLIGDFFHIDTVPGETKKPFEKLFKILPLFSKQFTEFLVNSGKYVYLKYLPYPLMLLLQILAGIKKRDYRYFIYLRYYPHRVWTRINK